MAAELDVTRGSINRWLQWYEADGIEGLVSIVGGKATTMRAMAEKTADLVTAKTGRSIPCRTQSTKLASYRRFYRDWA